MTSKHTRNFAGDRTRRIGTAMALVAMTVPLAGCPLEGPQLRAYACYGMENRPSVTAHLVEDALVGTTYYDSSLIRTVVASDGYDWGTCGALDDLAAGTAISLDAVQVDTTADWASSDGCFTASADATLPNAAVMTGEKDRDVLASGAPEYQSFSPMVTVVETDATFGTCAGRWILHVVPYEVIRQPTVLSTPESSADWSDARLFAQLTMGDKPPMIIQRYFLPAAGSDCSVIPDDGDRRCSDIFLGYLSN